MTFSYINEDERNLHIYASQSSTVNQPDVYCGCYMFETNMPTVKDIYEWMDFITDHALLPSETLRLVLYRFQGTHENLNVQDGVVSVRPAQNLVRIEQQDVAMTPGSYLLFAHEKDGSGGPVPISIVYQRRIELRFRVLSTSVTGSGTPTGRLDSSASPTTKEKWRRKVSTRKEVRRRDGECRITGVKSHFRKRGDNFTGLEVAHVVALGDVDTLSGLVHNQAFVSNPNLTALRMEDVDAPRNAFVLRSDIHALFDDYQFAIHWRTHKIFRFEASGAKILEGIELSRQMSLQAPTVRRSKYLKPYSQGTDIEDVDNDMFEIHFKLALLQHFSGGGRGMRLKATGDKGQPMDVDD